MKTFKDAPIIRSRWCSSLRRQKRNVSVFGILEKNIHEYISISLLKLKFTRLGFLSKKKNSKLPSFPLHREIICCSLKFYCVASFGRIISTFASCRSSISDSSAESASGEAREKGNTLEAGWFFQSKIIRVGSFNLLDTNLHVDSRKTFLEWRTFLPRIKQ